MKRHPPKGRSAAKGKPKPGRSGASQRQLRAGELVRHALVNVLYEEELQNETMAGVSVTITEVRLSPDLRNASVYVEPLGGQHADEVVKALNRHAGFLRGRLGHAIDMKFTPALKFLHDQSFAEAERMARLFDNPRIREDLAKVDAPEPEPAVVETRRITPKVPGSKGGVVITAPKTGPKTGNDNSGS
jgi:ribosome-binding factor A